MAIVGVAECDLGVTRRSTYELQTQAVTRALLDARLGLSDVDGIATTALARFSATSLADHLGLRPRWIDSSAAGGSVSEMYVARAAQAIEAGQCDTVVISYASNQRSAASRRLGGVVEEHTPEAQFETPYHPLWPLSYYALAAQRYLHDHDATRSDLAEVAVAAREWALLNPAAYRRDAGSLSVASVLETPMIASPLSTADCCLVTDGGGAVVLTSLERARDLTDCPIVVLGCGEATTHASMTADPDLTRTGAYDSAAEAFGRAGLTVADVDVTQVYDSFTITVLLSLEALGFCGRGEAAALARSGALRPGGSLPLNTSGGGLSYCHPGQLGILLLVEATRQLRGEGGARQVPGAEIALAHGTGGILSTHATVLLGVDR